MVSPEKLLSQLAHESTQDISKTRAMASDQRVKVED
jgi:hypothetical protein